MSKRAAKLAAVPPKGEAPAVAAYRLEEQVGHLLRRAHQRHAAIFQDGIGDLQLTPMQFAALVKIRDLGKVSQNQLGRLTAMDPATTQGVIQRLVARGVIERTAVARLWKGLLVSPIFQMYSASVPVWMRHPFQYTSGMSTTTVSLGRIPK